MSIPQTSDRLTSARYRVIPESLLFSDLSDGAVRFLLVLDSYLQRNETAWPSRKTLATDMSCSLDTVDRRIKELVAKGILKVAHRQHPDGGLASSEYRLVGTLTADLRPPGRVDHATGKNTIEGSTTHMSNAGVGRIFDPTYSPEFDAFWALYPRRTAKMTSWRKIQTLLRQGVTWQEIEQAARNYARSVEKTEQRFIKHAATFYGPDEHWREWLDTPLDRPVEPDPIEEYQRHHDEGVAPPKGLLASVRAKLGGA